MKTKNNSYTQPKSDSQKFDWKSGPDALVEYVEKNKNEFWKDLYHHRPLVIDTNRNGFKKGAIHY